MVERLGLEKYEREIIIDVEFLYSMILFNLKVRMLAVLKVRFHVQVLCYCWIFLLRKPAGRRLGGGGGGGGWGAPNLACWWGRGPAGGPRFWAILEAHGLAYGGAMLDAAWRLRGRFGACVGRMLAPVGSIWGSFWRLLG